MHNPSRLTPLSNALLLRQMFRSRPSMAAMGLALCMPVATQAQEAATDGSTQTATVNLAPTAIDSQYLGTATDGTGSYTTGAVSIGKGAPQSLRETPQSVSVMTRQVMDDNNLNSLSKVLEDTPGITFQYRNFGGHVYTSRGFSLLAESFLVDGIGGQGYQITGWMQPDMAIYDRVEVLRGASGLLVGAGQPGGAVNLVRKRPTADNKFSITTRAGSWDQYRVDLDGSGKLNDSGTVRGRMVAAYDDSGSYLDGRDSRTPLLYGIVEADVSDDTTLTMSLRRQEQVINGYSIYGLPRYSNGQSLNLSRSTNLAQKWNRLESDMTEVFTEVAHRFNEDWISKTSLTYSQGGFDQAIAYARGAINPTTLAGSNFQGTLFRKDKVDSVGLNSQLEGNFNAFGLEHQVTLGADWSKQDANTLQATVTRRTAVNVFDVNQSAFAKPARPAWTTDIDTTEERAGLYANTRIHLSEPLSVVLGSRLSWYDYTYDVKTGAANSYESKQTQEFTPFAGVIYDINDSWSWYASYADIFTPQANYVTASGSPLDPAIGSNYETGFKGELFDKRMNLSMALFYIKQKDVAGVDVNTTELCPTSSDGSCYLQDGISRSKGVDVEASGEVLPGLQVFGGYTFNMLRNNGDSDVAYETPKHLLRLNTSYNLPGAWNRLTLGTGVSADSGYEVPSNKQLGVAGKAIWDARASWKLDENWKVSLNAENLFDRKYYSTSIATDRSNVYGEPRSYVLTLRGDF
ncbi:TonB-dependent siderophore receptor [Pseudomonas syringae pv. actinidiae]|uniref:Outer membrane receptor for ferric coprogen and ferric-rhodotorulic acid n=6 Tax=Pseudomonas syringae TaxID=317 RepID=A0A2V0QD63_PSESF|nr:TonB-dependent siderophore receptor [Pseudomonas syringae]EPN73981.1 TonB-dependent siderophore receptor [Pseudomonas syringae pv. actinidiae ICMP 19101]AKT30361.1 ligand-gated channel [Pseudomonas syringae pv. actinidiae ICMP 18884]AOE56798.1 ligand-gated channel [Pseudomonas syringae pv. actinidiae ICMP 18708]APP97758.1 ligand-gated channel [Pseudomonas syringae pv. actinidiae]APQ03511.1 ligand-gated channel [Pseudomonas syringae pv. actinidiae]